MFFIRLASTKKICALGGLVVHKTRATWQVAPTISSIMAHASGLPKLNQMKPAALAVVFFPCKVSGWVWI